MGQWTAWGSSLGDASRSLQKYGRGADCFSRVWCHLVMYCTNKVNHCVEFNEDRRAWPSMLYFENDLRTSSDAARFGQCPSESRHRSGPAKWSTPISSSRWSNLLGITINLSIPEPLIIIDLFTMSIHKAQCFSSHSSPSYPLSPFSPSLTPTPTPPQQSTSPTLTTRVTTIPPPT